jgi:hypothetical protein
MKRRVLTYFSYVGLALVIVPSLFVFRGAMTLNMSIQLMSAGTAIWFVLTGIREYGLSKKDK